MGLKILHAADLHLDSPFASLPDAVRDSLRKEQLTIPGKLADLCQKEQCDMVLLAGDIFDGTAAGDTLTILKRELERCAVPVFITPGNHDFCCPGSPWLEENWPDNVYIFTGDWQAVDLPKLGCRVYGAGYRSMDCPPMLEGFHTQGDFRWHIGVLHGDPVNPASPCCPVTAAQVRDSGLHYLGLGHIHRAGGFRAGETFCAWPGCPMGRGWDETGDKGVCIVSVDDTAEITPVNLGLPTFHDLTVNVCSDALAALETVLPPAESGSCFRVTLKGTGQPDLTMLKERFSHLRHLELRDETEEPVELWDCIGDDSLRGVYFRMLKQKLEESDPDTQRLILMAAEISRRLMDGKEVELP